MLDVLASPDPDGPDIMRRPATRFADALRPSAKRLRIGLSTRSPVDAPVHPETLVGIYKTAQLLTDLGHCVEEAEPATGYKTLAHSFLTLLIGQIAAAIHATRVQTGAPESAFEPETRLLGKLGRAASAF